MISSTKHQHPIFLSEVEQDQTPMETDREAIVVGPGFCDGVDERAYTEFAPHSVGKKVKMF